MPSEHRESDLLTTATSVVNLLAMQDLKVVFAESCTAGLIAATLAKIPGISNYLCGSFVTYRNDSKSEWLGVSAQDLNSSEIGPVSATVAQQMTAGALEKSPEADIAVSVTGHLGPNAPEDLDGIAYSSIQFRKGLQQNFKEATVSRMQLAEAINSEESEESTLDVSLREYRLNQAVGMVLENLREILVSVRAQSDVSE